jgi:hypothetical protein
MLIISLGITVNIGSLSNMVSGLTNSPLEDLSQLFTIGLRRRWNDYSK